jgi:hypothetical protein
MALNTQVTAAKQTVAKSGTQTTWTAARNATSANSFINYTTSTDVSPSIRERRISDSYLVDRTFLFFDLSGINGTITNMVLKIYGVSSNNINVIPLKSTAFGDNRGDDFTASDFNEWSPSSPTPYTTGNQAWVINQYNSFTLNSTAISDANSGGYLNVVVLGNDYDYRDNPPTSNITTTAGTRFQNALTPLELDITYNTTPTGWSGDINSVSVQDSINGVLNTSISSINNIS